MAGKDLMYEPMNPRLRLILFVFVLATILGIVILITPNILSLYYQVRGGQLLEEVYQLDAGLSDGIVCEGPPPVNIVGKLQLKKAALQLQRAIHYKPNNAQARLLLGRAQCLLGESEKSIESLRVYTELRPENPLGNLEMGFAYETLCRQEFGASSIPSVEKSTMILCTNSALLSNILFEWEKSGLTSQDFLQMGEQLYQAGQNSEALLWYARSLLLDSANPNSFYAIGHILMDQGQNVRAIEFFEKAVEISSGDIRFHYDLVEALIKENRLDRAKAEMDSVLDVYLRKIETSGEAEANILYEMILSLARVNRKLNEWDESERWYGVAKQIHPDDVRIDAELADMYLLTNRPSKAIEQLKSVPSDVQKQTPLYHLFGRAYLQLGKYDLAIEELLLATQEWPTTSEMYYWLGEAYLASGEIVLAEYSFQKSLKLDPMNQLVQKRLEAIQQKKP
jgi:tetratricopeptide (TPR) repeat protein